MWSYQFQTRTKTDRSRELHETAPDAFVQMHPEDAQRLGISQGDMVEVGTRRGTVRASAELGDIMLGTVSIPYHYGCWDEHEGRHRAADELTLTAWDPVSKQPYYKFAAAQVEKLGETSLGERVADLGAKPLHDAKEAMEKMTSSVPPIRPHVPDYLGLLKEANLQFADACDMVSQRAAGQLELQVGLEQLAMFSREALTILAPFSARYGRKAPEEPSRLREALIPAIQPGAFGILRNLHGLFILTTEVATALTIVEQAAKALADAEFIAACSRMRELNKRQERWLDTYIRHIAPHILVVPQ